MNYKIKLTDVTKPLAEILQPPNRIEPWEFVCDNMYVSGAGGHSEGLYQGDLTPYMKEPLNAMFERRYKSVIYAGPAQAGKSLSLLNGFFFHQMLNCPHDAMMITNSMERATDWSRRSFDRMVSSNPKLQDIVLTGKDSSLSRKTLKNGVMLTITHGTPNTLAGRSFRTVLITDLDRTTTTGEGDIVQLAMARTRTFGSQAMVMAESSPSFDLAASHRGWERKSLHEAPPVGGILGLYNGGDRRIIYWACGHCDSFFAPQATLDGFFVPKEGSDASRIVGAGVVCPTCGGLNTDDHRHAMIQSARWVAEGQEIDIDTGEVTGDLPDNDTASFWLPGVCAAFTNFKGLAKNFLKADKLYQSTFNEESLKVFVNTDLGGVYEYKSSQDEKDPHEYSQRAEDYKKEYIPEETECLVSTVDVQKGSFIVQVHAMGREGEMWIADRIKLQYSKRSDGEGNSDALNPASFPEDWNILIEKVIEAEYITPDGKLFKPMLTLCDSGGERGVTQNAYKFVRRLKATGLHKKFQLVKGASSSMRDHFKMTKPDQAKTGTNSGARGDIELLMLNTNMLKDMVYSRINREEVGPNYLHMPGWIPDWWYEELVSEVRVNGKYEKKTARARNESLDLMAYAEAGLLWKGYYAINWEGRLPFWIGPTSKFRKAAGHRTQSRNNVRHRFDNGLD